MSKYFCLTCKQKIPPHKVKRTVDGELCHEHEVREYTPDGEMIAWSPDYCGPVKEEE